MLGVRGTLGDEYLAQASDLEAFGIAAVTATAAVLGGYAGIAAAGALGFGTFGTAVVAGGLGGGAEYLALTGSAATFNAINGYDADVGPTLDDFATSVSFGAAGGGVFHGASFALRPVAFYAGQGIATTGRALAPAIGRGINATGRAISRVGVVQDTVLPYARGFNQALRELPADLRLDSQRVRDHLGTKRLRFASREEVLELTGLKPGSIPPFGSLFGLDTLCDERLANEAEINFNAGDHSISIAMTSEDYIATEKPKMGVFGEDRE